MGKADFCAAFSQTGYSENSETVSRSFTWLTLASPKSSYLHLSQKVLFPTETQRFLRKCASVCIERRLQISWSLSTDSIFFRSHLAEIVETQRMRSWRLKESCGFPKVFLWCQVAKNCLSQPPRPACQRSILPRKPVEPSGFQIHKFRLHLE